jgi:hypothetical protein
MSKGYTISYFIDVLKNTTARQVTNKGVFNVVSPRFGDFSVKAEALDTWLNYATTTIARGEGRFATYGKTARARLLTALRNRKEHGTV